MLQQTQVATVIDYYHRFTDRFPTPTSLAKAEEQEVLSYWAGLGYYRRAKQLHKAAQVIAEEYDGSFPMHFDDILALPGIGRYTAGAIASFAYGQRHPILEANTIRLHARLLAVREPTQSTSVQKALWEFAEDLLPVRGDVATLNQALMELGSLVCVPKSPRCLCCPVAELCPTMAQGLQDSIPSPKAKKQLTPLEHGAVILHHRGKVLLRQNQPGEWWEGLWDFPRVQIEIDEGVRDKLPPTKASKTAAPLAANVLDQISASTCSALQESFGLECEISEFLQTVKHGVTRYSITLFCFEGRPSNDVNRLPGEWKWASKAELIDLPLTSTAKRLAKDV